MSMKKIQDFWKLFQVLILFWLQTAMGSIRYCSSQELCEGSGEVCDKLTSTCMCREGLYRLTPRSQCKPFALLNIECIRDSQCFKPNHVCRANNTCGCPDGSNSKYQKCEKLTSSHSFYNLPLNIAQHSHFIVLAIFMCCFMCSCCKCVLNKEFLIECLFGEILRESNEDTSQSSSEQNMQVSTICIPEISETPPPSYETLEPPTYEEAMANEKKLDEINQTANPV